MLKCIKIQRFSQGQQAWLHNNRPQQQFSAYKQKLFLASSGHYALSETSFVGGGKESSLISRQPREVVVVYVPYRIQLLLHQYIKCRSLMPSDQSLLVVPRSWPKAKAFEVASSKPQNALPLCYIWDLWTWFYFSFRLDLKRGQIRQIFFPGLPASYTHYTLRIQELHNPGNPHHEAPGARFSCWC